MQLQTLWSEFSTKQLDYITNIIKNSDAKSICELGTFVGTSAKHIWDGIKDTDKKLYLVDNYLFLPKKYRWAFFNTIKNSIDKDTKNIIPILQSSHKYNWTQHDFVIFGHHDYDHMLPDFNILLQSDVKYAIIDINSKCFDRFNLLLHSVVTQESNLKLQYYIDGIFVLGREKLKCTLPTKNKLFFHRQIKCMPKGTGTYLQAIKNIQNMLGIKK